MVEEIRIPDGLDKKERYELLLKQADSLIEAEDDLIANLSNLSSLMKQVLLPLWVGFYRMMNEELVLGPFQGPLGCTRITLDKGVCGAAATQKKTIVVGNVSEFPDHIACSPDSRSEIVVPIISAGKVCLVLDLDSENLNNYGDLDVKYLEELCNRIQGKHFP